MKEIKNKRKRKRNKKRKTTLLGPAQAGQPTKAPSSFFFSLRAHTIEVILNLQRTYVAEKPSWQFTFLSLSPSILVLLSLQFQYKSCSEFNEGIIQGNYFPLGCLNLSNSTRVPNANHRHSPLDLLPQSIIGRTKESNMCP
jgi:hypothetical protein